MQISALLPATAGFVTQRVVALVRCHPRAAVALTAGAVSLAGAGSFAARYGIRQLRKPKDVFAAGGLGVDDSGWGEGTSSALGALGSSKVGNWQLEPWSLETAI
ncbi:MAG: hypothetical protein H7A39_01550 [Chlamydiales bacterium]|nr:hypothetical protein [Chlamydiales bacterium]